jgi:hypothetical protein
MHRHDDESPPPERGLQRARPESSPAERGRDHTSPESSAPEPAGAGGGASELLAQRALERGRAGALDAGAVAHLQRAAGNAGVGSLLGGEAPDSPVLDVVGSGGGQPLDNRTRADMESSFGHDFGDVRVHTDGAASRSAEAVQAQAYTVGDDVVFRSGGYQPGTGSGRHLIAHELAHVVQQRSGPVDGTPTDDGLSLSDPSDSFEQAAEQTAEQLDEP